MSSIMGYSSLSILKQCFHLCLCLMVWAAWKLAWVCFVTHPHVPGPCAWPNGLSTGEATTSDSWTELNCLVSNSELHSGTVTYDSHYIPYPSALHTHTMRKFILKNWPTVWLPQFSMIEEPRYTNRTICFPSWVLSLEALFIECCVGPSRYLVAASAIVYT